MEKAGRKDESKWVHGGGTETQWKRRFREKKERMVGTRERISGIEEIIKMEVLYEM